MNTQIQTPQEKYRAAYHLRLEGKTFREIRFILHFPGPHGARLAVGKGRWLERQHRLVVHFLVLLAARKREQIRQDIATVQMQARKRTLAFANALFRLNQVPPTTRPIRIHLRTKLPPPLPGEPYDKTRHFWVNQKGSPMAICLNCKAETLFPLAIGRARCISFTNDELSAC